VDRTPDFRVHQPLLGLAADFREISLGTLRRPAGSRGFCPGPGSGLPGTFRDNTSLFGQRSRRLGHAACLLGLDSQLFSLDP
jgi:hypothetical protein